MVARRIVLFLIVCTSFCMAQDKIRGTYSYTYGDKESLVEARQTCKDLALREAIESYYIFVESSTDVENFQLKEDIIKSLTAGYVKNVQITEQEEEGRTITMTVEATVDPDEVKALVEKQALAKDEESPSDAPDSSQPETEEKEDDSPFLKDLAEYQARMKRAEISWGNKNYDAALAQLQELEPLVARYSPSKENQFQWLTHQATTTRIAILKDFIRAERFEARGNKLRARANVRLMVKKAEELKGYTKRLERLENLTDKQKVLRTTTVTQCQMTLKLVDKKVASIGIR